MKITEISPAHQDYLKTIYLLHSRGQAATNSAIAQALGVAPASATNMVQRLAEAGLIEYNRYHDVRLTPEGERAALEIVRHHRLIELFLHEILDMPWDKVHAEAERLEHVLSEEVEEAIARKLGYPTVDPHGDPIPSKDGALADQTADGPLSALAPGQLATISRVYIQDSARLRYLGDLGLYPGARVRVVERSPFEGPLLVDVDGESRMVSYAMASALSVTMVR